MGPGCARLLIPKGCDPLGRLKTLTLDLLISHDGWMVRKTSETQWVQDDGREWRERLDMVRGCDLLHFDELRPNPQSPFSSASIITDSIPSQASLFPSSSLYLPRPRPCRENCKDRQRGLRTNLECLESAYWWPVDLIWLEDPICFLIIH